MKKNMLKFAFLLALAGGSAVFSHAQSGGGPPIFVEGTSGGGSAAGGGPPTITFLSNQPFSCSATTITILSVTGGNVVAQDACGNTFNVVAAGNVAWLTSGVTFSISQVTGNGNHIEIVVRAN